MKQRKVVSMIGALVLIISAVVLITGCSQPNSNKGNTGNNSGNISNNGGNTGNNGGNTGNNGGNTGNNGGNTGNNGGNTGNTTPAKYTVYLKNKSRTGTITFWYVEESDNKDITYYGDTAIAPGEIGIITNIPGNKKYNLNSLVKYKGSSETVPKWIDEFYLDENKTFVLE